MTERTTTNSLMRPPGGRSSERKFGPGTIELFSGEPYDFEHPDPAKIRLEDIAHSLSNMCRFAGHVKRFQSVAEHSVLVSRILESQGVSKVWQEVGLLHDAHEAFIWDCPRPLKPLLGPDFKRLARLADYAVGTKFKLEPAMFTHPWVKEADNIALCAEREELMVSGPETWEPGYENVPPLPLGLGVHAFLPTQAEYLFLDRAKELGL